MLRCVNIDALHQWCDYLSSQITEGSAKMLVTAVGADSEWGKTMALVAGEAAETPLQLSLGTLAAAIGKVGLAVGGVCFLVLLVRQATIDSPLCIAAMTGTSKLTIKTKNFPGPLTQATKAI